MIRLITAYYGNQPYEFRELEPAPLEPAPLAYTIRDIKDQLRFSGGTNELRFRYLLLDKKGRRKKQLDTVVSGEVSMAAFANIKRTARFKIKEDNDIDWLNDRIQPFCMLKMPNNTWVEWSLGIFLLTSPTRVEENRIVFREVEAYDGLMILEDDKVLERYMITEGTSYISAIYNLLRSAGITKINIEQTDTLLNKDIEYEAGTNKGAIVADLLSEINWTTLWVDEDGYFTAKRYVSPTDLEPNIQYFDDELSILKRGMKEDLDLSQVPNSWSVVASNPEELPLTSIYINENPDSLTSTVSRGRTIVDFREKDNISSQLALDEFIKRIAFEASQVYGYLEFETALNPLHSYNDILDIRYKPLGIEGKYSEVNWTMPLEAGQTMRHKVRKVVQI